MGNLLLKITGEVERTRKYEKDQEDFHKRIAEKLKELGYKVEDKAINDTTMPDKLITGELFQQHFTKGVNVILVTSAGGPNKYSNAEKRYDAIITYFNLDALSEHELEWCWFKMSPEEQ